MGEVKLPDLPRPLTSSRHWDAGIDWAVAGERAARMEREDQMRDLYADHARVLAEKGVAIRHMREALVACSKALDEVEFADTSGQEYSPKCPVCQVVCRPHKKDCVLEAARRMAATEVALAQHDQQKAGAL